MFLGRYMYFDNDGMVVEAARKYPHRAFHRLQVLHLTILSCTEKPPIENDQIFQNVLTILQAS